MKNRTLILSLSLVAVMALAAVSFAGPGYGRGYHMGNGFGPGYGMMGAGYHMGNGRGPAANLTDDQRAALEKTAQDYAAKVEPLRADLYAKNLELAAELAKASPDQSRITALTKDVNDLQAKLFTEQTAFRASLAKDYGIRAGMGGGYGMANGFGPGNCPFWGADDDDRAN